MNHKELYKDLKNKNDRQEKRRKELLEEQKRKRLEKQDENRCSYLKSDKVKKDQRRKFKGTLQETYGNELSLQLSEWLTESPDDFCNWMLVPCPKGQRCIVVSEGGKCKMFSKAGRFRMAFKAIIPGGGEGEYSKGSCMLDCIYNEAVDSFYVLDILYFGCQNMMDCEAVFRFFWLQSKFDDIDDEIECKQMENAKQFFLLTKYDMGNDEQVGVALQTFPLWPNNQPPLDGFLFYHKESSYVCGRTPLVCWLFAFMIPDILSYAVSNQYTRPHNYSDPWQFMEQFDKELAHKRQKHSSKLHMELDNSIDPSACSLEELEAAKMDEENDSENSTENILKTERLLELEGIL